MKVLCVCTGNTCRSPMLAALLRSRLEAAGLADRVSVESAGLAAGEKNPASAEAVVVLKRRGIDLRSHRSRNAGTLDLTSYDRIYCLNEQHAFVLHGRGIDGKKLHVVNARAGGVPDPYGLGEDAYERTVTILEGEADAITAAIKAAVANDSAGWPTQG